MAYGFNNDKSKATIYGNTIGNAVTIPRTLSNSDRAATFDYTFPADGYLVVNNNNDDGTLPVISFDLKLNNIVPIGDTMKFHFLTTRTINGDNISYDNKYNYRSLILFVKKGMTFSGQIWMSMPSYVAAIETLFYPFS